MSPRLLNIGFLFLLAATSACQRAQFTSEELARRVVRIQIVPHSDSPFWKDTIRRYVTRHVNDYARYKIADSTPEPTTTHKLVIRPVHVESRAVGASGGSIGYQGAYGISTTSTRSNFKYQDRFEATAQLVDQNGKIIWEWEGWGRSKSEERSVAEFGNKLGEAMRNQKILNPDFFDKPRTRP